jgi:uncharacterized protein YdhG (YjbR/CyaY superfamily)
MTYEANKTEEYISQLPADRKIAIENLRIDIKINLPKGFEEGINYKMLGYYVPQSKYPKEHHCDPKLPLPFINIASQKNSVNLHHMGICAKKELHNWFVSEYPKHCKPKLDMGKGCVQFKKMDEIPYDLIGELASLINTNQWIKVH